MEWKFFIESKREKTPSLGRKNSTDIYIYNRGRNAGETRKLSTVSKNKRGAFEYEGRWFSLRVMRDKTR